MTIRCLFALALALCGYSGVFIDAASAQQHVAFPASDKSAEIQADLYGGGSRGVLLAHGGRFGKESWRKQAEALAAAGHLVLAIRFRGDSFNPDGTPSAEGSDEDNAADVAAGVAYLRRRGASTIAAVGGSLGGDAVGIADAKAPGGIDRVVFLGSTGGGEPEKLTGRKLFVVARDDGNAEGLRLPRISANYAKAREPKTMIVVEGKAHAQFLFETDQGPRVLREIVRFLSAP